MVPAATPKIPTTAGADLFFKCEHCGIALVVNSTAAGMTLKCRRCGQPTIVPRSAPSVTVASAPVPIPPERLDELKRRLKENESQRTEINGYINQLNIQLHRWQLRLQTLNERNKELTDQMADGGVAGNSQPPSQA